MKYQNAILLSGLLSGEVSAQMFKKVKLKDVDVLTLYQGKMTNGRRSSPIPQLQCRGGSAGCSAFVPDVVQCYNKGSDGLEIQWECKTEMPMEYKFGKIQVSCEGYDYPDDPYILAGSCGLEYTIDRTGVNPSRDSKKSNNGNSGYSTNGWNHGKSYQGMENLFTEFVSKTSSYVTDNIPDMSHVTSTMEKVKTGSKSSLKSLFKIAKSKTIQFFGAVESLLDDNPEENPS